MKLRESIETLGSWRLLVHIKLQSPCCIVQVEERATRWSYYEGFEKCYLEIVLLETSPENFTLCQCMKHHFDECFLAVCGLKYLSFIILMALWDENFTHSKTEQMGTVSLWEQNG